MRCRDLPEDKYDYKPIRIHGRSGILQHVSGIHVLLHGFGTERSRAIRMIQPADLKINNKGTW